MAWDGVLVRFGEIGIKSPPVRRRMLDRLRSNLLDLMVRRGVEGNVRPADSRLLMVGPDAEALLGVATHCFGVVSASPVALCKPTMEALKETAVRLALAEGDWTSFAVRARREGKHGFSSQDIGIQVGSAVFQAKQAAGGTPKVDLGSPDREVHLDVRQDTAYAYTRVVPGPGGLPMGVQGKVLALVSDPASFVAAWLVMRRGAAVVPVHAGQAQSLAVGNVEALQHWGLGSEVDLLPICTGFVAKPVLLDAARVLARRIGAVALVTGDTLDSDLTADTGAMPVLRPVCGLLPSDVQAYAQRIGLTDDEPEHVFDDASTETVESVLSMHRIVEV